MKIEVGRKYKSRDGDVVTVVHKSESCVYPFICVGTIHPYYTVSEDGLYAIHNPEDYECFDLVEEIPPPCEDDFPTSYDSNIPETSDEYPRNSILQKCYDICAREIERIDLQSCRGDFSLEDAQTLEILIKSLKATYTMELVYLNNT